MEKRTFTHKCASGITTLMLVLFSGLVPLLKAADDPTTIPTTPIPL